MIRCKSRLMEFQTINYKEKLSYIEEELAKQSNNNNTNVNVNGNGGTNTNTSANTNG
jgi:hypothetical protein